MTPILIAYVTAEDATVLGSTYTPDSIGAVSSPIVGLAEAAELGHPVVPFCDASLKELVAAGCRISTDHDIGKWLGPYLWTLGMVRATDDPVLAAVTKALAELRPEVWLVDVADVAREVAGALSHEPKLWVGDDPTLFIFEHLRGVGWLSDAGDCIGAAQEAVAAWRAVTSR